MVNTKGGFESSGTYDWQASYGSIIQKYMYIALVNAQTADGIRFHVAATTYLNEYKKESIKDSFIQNAPLVFLILGFVVLMILFVLLYTGIFKFGKHTLKVRKYSLREKVLALLILSFIIPLIGVISFLGVGGKELTVDQVSDGLQVVSNEIEKSLDDFIQKHKDLTLFLSQEYQYRELLEADLDGTLSEDQRILVNQEFEKIIPVEPELYQISVINIEGEVIASSDPGPIDLNKKEISDLLISTRGYIKPPHRSLAFGGGCLDYGFPVYIKDKKGKRKTEITSIMKSIEYENAPNILPRHLGFLKHIMNEVYGMKVSIVRRNPYTLKDSPNANSSKKAKSATN